MQPWLDAAGPDAVIMKKPAVHEEVSMNIYMMYVCIILFSFLMYFTLDKSLQYYCSFNYFVFPFLCGVISIRFIREHIFFINNEKHLKYLCYTLVYTIHLYVYLALNISLVERKFQG